MTPPRPPSPPIPSTSWARVWKKKRAAEEEKQKEATVTPNIIIQTSTSTAFLTSHSLQTQVVSQKTELQVEEEYVPKKKRAKKKHEDEKETQPSSSIWTEVKPIEPKQFTFIEYGGEINSSESSSNEEEDNDFASSCLEKYEQLWKESLSDFTKKGLHPFYETKKILVNKVTSIQFTAYKQVESHLLETEKQMMLKLEKGKTVTFKEYVDLRSVRDAVPVTTAQESNFMTYFFPTSLKKEYDTTRINKHSLRCPLWAILSVLYNKYKSDIASESDTTEGTKFEKYFFDKLKNNKYENKQQALDEIDANEQILAPRRLKTLKNRAHCKFAKKTDLSNDQKEEMKNKLLISIEERLKELIQKTDPDEFETQKALLISQVQEGDKTSLPLTAEYLNMSNQLDEEDISKLKTILSGSISLQEYTKLRDEFLPLKAKSPHLFSIFFPCSTVLALKEGEFPFLIHPYTRIYAKTKHHYKIMLNKKGLSE